MLTTIFYSDKNLAARYKVTRTTIWYWIKTAGFPAPYHLTPGCSRWREDEIEAWESSRAQGRIRKNQAA